MSFTLRGDRATSAVPVSLAARFAAWARESLVARAIAIAAGLVVLAVIGGSALAGNAGAGASAATGMTSATPGSALWAPAAVGSAVDAGAELATSPLPAITSSASPRARASPDDPVNLDTANADELRRLPGVGAKRAEAILALRARLGGRFRQIEDLLKVKGIGRAMLRRLHPLVRVTGARGDAGAASA